MAYFAELDENNKVIRICVVDDAHVPSDKHVDGEKWCENFWGGTWKQTTKTRSFRANYAGRGDTYDSAKDQFIKPEPEPLGAWTLKDDGHWEPPDWYSSDVWKIMCHFAELDGSNVVKRIVTVSRDISTAAGPLGDNPMHVDGETFCFNHFGSGVWKQTSYNHAFRKQYAGVGYTYDAVKDVFIGIEPKPLGAWTLDSDSDWEPPTWWDSQWAKSQPYKAWLFEELDGAYDFLLTEGAGTWYGLNGSKVGKWYPPVDYPSDKKKYNWDNATDSWVAV